MKNYKSENIRRLSGSLVILFVLLLTTCGTVVAQQAAQKAVKVPNMFENKAMIEIARPVEDPGWVDFQNDLEINPNTVFTDHRTAFELGQNDQMIVQKIQTDEINFTHYRYQQYFKGVKIVGAEFIVHTDDQGITRSANGKLMNNLDMTVIPALKEKQALQFAMNHADGTAFLWENAAMEEALKLEKKDPNATYYPTGELVIQRTDLNGPFSPENAVLAWKFDIRTGFSGESRSIYVNANTGDLVNYVPISMSCSGGTGPTTWNGSRGISTQDIGIFVPNYRLFDDCTGSHAYTLQTLNMLRSSSTGGAVEYTDGDNIWNAAAQQTGFTTHWAMHETRDYYSSIHARSSWDGGAANWLSYNEGFILGTHNNACWGCTGNSAAFGGGNSSALATDDWNTLDIVGHEFTHGVTQTSANLTYSNESGALNESFSDIFGEMVELRTSGTRDWLVGGERGAIRSFSNPNAYGDPDTYLGTNWYTGTADNGGVHTNSGVQNFWFYLLSVGGSGTNDNGTNYSVSGIGEAAARAIAYRNLTVYLTSGSQYIDARQGALRSARDLYGGCSNNEIQTGIAWHAAGVGNSLGIYNWNLCGTYTSGFWQGINSVVAGVSCATTVNATTSGVTFTAANEVILGPNFLATASGTNQFIAYLEPCSYTRWKDGDEMVGDEFVQDVYDAPAASILELHDENSLDVYPNPFDQMTTISYTMSAEGSMNLSVYDITGKLISTLIDETDHKSGKFDVQFNAIELPAGPYLCQMVTSEGTSTVKLVIFK